MITYQTAYLKRFYPVEFMAALLTTSSGSTDDIVKYIREARAHKIRVLPPDINVSNKHFTVDYIDNPSKDISYGNIRFGLSAVKGLGDAALEIILSTREHKGASKSLFNFCQNVASSKINKKVLEALIKSGAMDSFSRPRKQLMHSTDKAMAQAMRLQKDNNRGQTSMFDMFGSSKEIEPEDYKEVSEYSQRDLLGMEKEAVGFYLSGHPLDPYDKEAKSLGAITTAQLSSVRHLEEVLVFGVVTELKERPLKSGNGRWAVAIIEDSYGQAELLCFSTAYEEAERLLKSKEPLVISGRALVEEALEEGTQPKPKLRLKDVRLLAEAQLAKTSLVDIDLRQSKTDEKVLQKLHEFLSVHKGDKPLLIKLLIENDVEVVITPRASLRVMPTDEFLAMLQESIPKIGVRRC